MFDQTQIKQLIQAAEQAWYACPHQTCLIRGCPKEQNIAHQTREQTKCLICLIKCLMAFKCSNGTKQGVQTIKCLVTKQCLMVDTKHFSFAQAFSASQERLEHPLQAFLSPSPRNVELQHIRNPFFLEQSESGTYSSAEWTRLMLLLLISNRFLMTTTLMLSE